MPALKKISTTLLITSILLIMSMAVVNAQGDTAELGVFDSVEVAPGAVVQVPVSVRYVQELYGVEVNLTFDPALLQVEDADPAAPGIQIALGDFLDAGLLLFNTADNENGTIRFVMSQYNPSEAKSGNGNILVISFKGAAEGESPLEVKDVQLSTREGVAIPVEVVSSSAVVRVDAPAQAATYPVAELTGLIVLGTFTPTPTFTATPVPTETPLPTQTLPSEIEPGDDGTAGDVAAGNNEPGEGKSFIAQNWWIGLLLALLAVAAGFYYRKTRKKVNTNEEMEP